MMLDKCPTLKSQLFNLSQYKNEKCIIFDKKNEKAEF